MRTRLEGNSVPQAPKPTAVRLPSCPPPPRAHRSSSPALIPGSHAVPRITLFPRQPVTVHGPQEHWTRVDLPRPVEHSKGGPGDLETVGGRGQAGERPVESGEKSRDGQGAAARPWEHDVWDLQKEMPTATVTVNLGALQGGTSMGFLGLPNPGRIWVLLHSGQPGQERGSVHTQHVSSRQADPGANPRGQTGAAEQSHS